ncbi:PD-(D/E)XK motif protein [Cumulibacter manganitolerans]|uniref:PD-(D/E)XK motif protein n=1 Tax=Cumulibacter manganitolerans TaxID=1884992 RepID=UPI0012962FB1|nr:PD-(D/E)XK motif protein [Cumulibacter manganitolerans]
MTETDQTTYEQLKSYVGSLDPAPSSIERYIGFADEGHSIALSRDEGGRVEVFLVGERLAASQAVVDRAMDYRDDWQSSNEGAICANQIVLPGDAHFDSAAALICVELIEAGYNDDPTGAFAQVEPLIAKFIYGADQVGDQVLVGLYGELVLLDELTVSVQPAVVDDLVQSWFGWRPSSRDFQLGAIGVEVKTTSGSTSTHHIQGFQQVEVGHPVTDVAETSLHLLSLGVLAVPKGQRAGETVPSIVERILQRITSTSAQADFLDRVQQYGGDASLGYKHARDKNKSRFQKRFSRTFERLYDLADDNLRILKRSDVAGFSHIDVDSVEFRIALPYPFRGVVNPVSGLTSIVDLLLDLPTR